MSDLKLMQKLKTDLQSTDEKVLLDTIQEMRKIGNASVIEEIINLRVRTSNINVQKAIDDFLKDIKDKNAVEPLVEAIKNPVNNKIINTLVGICWQTNLDFSPHISVFTDIAIRGDYQIAIEAFSVIEEALPFLSKEQTLVEIKTLEKAVMKSQNEKRMLLQELIKTYKNR